ncbi:NAD-dependent protein deacetylase [Favolaschia claudopus]|uniref:NAD-dependent protein deacetylase n=1 Tax=Favolaschia claudopus TaxID=2862362 RepID=A0AAW0DBW4_9AGAR
MSSQKKAFKSKDIAGLADFIASDKCKNVVLMTSHSGAIDLRCSSWVQVSVSTSAGIPDFRSPETGLYYSPALLKLPYPEAVFEINFFRKNPVPFYTLAHELYPGKFRPTITHSFIRLLAKRGLLHTCFTQNIDTLERRAGVPDDQVIEAHGSFATQRCIDCKKVYDDAKMKVKIDAMETPHCESCRGLVKPDIVFFGESLPDQFINAMPNVWKADILIIMGTSLTVHPFAGLAERAPPTCPRVLINLDLVGGIGRRPNDMVLLGKCDDVVRALCKKLGWEKELEGLWERTALGKGWEEPESGGDGEEEVVVVKKEEEGEKASLEDVVGAIADAIGKNLNIDGNDGTPAAEDSSKDDTALKKEPTAAKEEAKEDKDTTTTPAKEDVRKEEPEGKL